MTFKKTAMVIAMQNIQLCIVEGKNKLLFWGNVILKSNIGREAPNVPISPYARTHSVVSRGGSALRSCKGPVWIRAWEVAVTLWGAPSRKCKTSECQNWSLQKWNVNQIAATKIPKKKHTIYIYILNIWDIYETYISVTFTMAWWPQFFRSHPWWWCSGATPRSWNFTNCGDIRTSKVQRTHLVIKLLVNTVNTSHRHFTCLKVCFSCTAGTAAAAAAPHCNPICPS